MSNSGNQRNNGHQDLLDALFADEPSAELREKADSLLQTDAEFRRLYVQTLQLRADLEWGSLAVRRSTVRTGDQPASRAPQWIQFLARPTPLSIAVAALVIGLLITGMALMVPPFYRAVTEGEEEVPPTSLESVAVLFDSHDASWAEGQVGIRHGARLLAGHRMNLKQGTATIQFNQGAKVTLRGPCEFTVDSTSTGSLRRGEISASVPPEAVGFTVETPVATVLDLGTEFILQASNAHAIVHVVTGKVEFASRSTGDKLLLMQGQCGKVGEVGAIARIRTPMEFAHILQRPLAPPDSRVVSIRDASFEETVCPDLSSVAPSVWQCEPADFVAIFDPQDRQFNGTTGDGANAAGVLPTGGQVGVVQGGGALPGRIASTSLWQVLDEEVAPGATYTLYFMVGARADRPELSPAYRVELVAGEQAIIDTATPVVPPAGEFRLVRLQHIAPHDAKGQLLIRFSFAGKEGAQTFIDDVGLYVNHDDNSNGDSAKQ